MTEYRPEIDGLRAIAVSSVILFHAGVPGVAGGFVGVDVFFVISGFLITGIIARELADGRFSFRRFFERRVRRLMPALLLVLSCAWLAGALILPPEGLEHLSESVLATLGLSANIFFWRQSGYFDPDADKAPLLHMWSLSLEEQFYLLFPLTLLAAWRLGRRWPIGLVLGGLGASFALSVWGTGAYPGATFYLLPTRAWELLLGASCALLARGAESGARPTTEALTDRRGETVAAGGLLLVLASIVLLDEYTPFPGLAALAPTVGTAALLVAGTPATHTGRLLASPPFVLVGLMSYSAYLWHQPLFVLHRAHTLAAPSTATRAALIGGTLLLAWVSWRYVERPFRDARRVPTGRLARSVGAAAAVAASLAIVGRMSHGLPQRFAVPASVVASMAEPTGAESCFDGDVDGAAEAWQCPLGQRGRSPSFVVVGDSHARALYPAFDDAATAANRAGRLVGRNGCAPLLDVHVYRPLHGWTDCRRLAERTLELVRAARVPTVILVARWSYYLKGDYDGHNMAFVSAQPGAVPSPTRNLTTLRAALDTTIAHYTAAGARVVLVDQVPQQLAEAGEVYARAFFGAHEDSTEELARASVSVIRHRSLQTASDSLLAAAARRSAMVRRVSLDSAYCDSRRCPIGDAVASWYTDADHLSRRGALRSVGTLTSVLASTP